MKPFNMFENKKVNYRPIVIIGLLSFSITLVIGLSAIKIAPHLGNYVPAVKEALALATTRKPETFTELYFEDHINLPKTINRHEEYSFAFTIHNLEYKDMEYPYVVYLETIDKKIILDQNKISLKNGEYKSVKEDFGPLKDIRMKIVIELVGRNQQIAFWMEGQNGQF